MPIIEDGEFLCETLVSRDELARLVCVVEAILARRQAARDSNSDLLTKQPRSAKSTPAERRPP
jgi:hypothetical protein